MIWEPNNQPRWRRGRRAEVYPGEKSARQSRQWRRDLLGIGIGVVGGIVMVVVLVLT